MFESFILAGGKSSRMKRNKALLKLGEKTLLEHSISTLQKINSKKISIVVADISGEFDNFHTQLSIISDIYKNRGTLGGIHSALVNCKEDFAVILACDFPFVSQDLLKFLIETIQKTEANCVAPIQKDGFIQPLCAVYNIKTGLKEITKILEKGEKLPSTRVILKTLQTHFVKFEEFSNMPNAENFFFNVNTPQDFEKALEIKKILDEK